MKLDEIGALCGFSSPTYFCKVFKKEIGITPGEFRKNKA
jgi:AraC-like DNA-binding protein